MEREALKLALEPLYPIAHNTTDDPRGQAYKAIAAIKEALAQPAQRTWVDLTDEDIHNTVGYNETREMYQFALALIAKLKDKNNG